MLLRVDDTAQSGGLLTVTEYSTPPAITEPSAADSIDGDALGF